MEWIAVLLMLVLLSPLIKGFLSGLRDTDSGQQPASQMQKNSAETSRKHMRWSGKIDGPLPLKALTFNQSFCLSDASVGKRIIPSRLNESYGDAPENIAFHLARTVDSLVKHGFLAADGKGAFVCTDLGLRAFETLPSR